MPLIRQIVINNATYDIGPASGKVFFGTSSSAANADVKNITCKDFTESKDLTSETILIVQFSKYNTSSNVYLKINNGLSKAVKHKNSAGQFTSPPSERYGYYAIFVYDGTYWNLITNSTEGEVIHDVIGWSDIINKPSSFTPSAHTHDYNKVSITNTLSSGTALAKITINTNGTTSTSTINVPVASSSTPGIMKLNASGGAAPYGHTHSAAEIANINSYSNQNAFSNVTVGSTTMVADAVQDTLILAASNSLTITPDASNDKIVFGINWPTSYTPTTHIHSTASSSAAGFMPALPTSNASTQWLNGNKEWSIPLLGKTADHITITSGSDLNNYTTPGVYVSFNADVSGTLANCPFSAHGFRMYVIENISGYGYIRQLIINKNTTVANEIWTRNGRNGTWTPWEQIIKDTYVSGLSWADGTTSGPVLTLSRAGTTTTSITGTIPKASASASGVVTTGSQTFAGAKTFNGAVTLGNKLIASSTMVGTALPSTSSATEYQIFFKI